MTSRRPGTQLIEAAESSSVYSSAWCSRPCRVVDHGRALLDRDRADLGGELDVGTGRAIGENSTSSQ
jgi:hypothetical protein